MSAACGVVTGRLLITGLYAGLAQSLPVAECVHMVGMSLLRETMRLSRIGYYGDFFVLPLLGITLAAAGLIHSRPDQDFIWAVLFAAGAACWTLIEYALHRVVLHHVPFFEQMHEAHHAQPLAAVGAPTWISLPLLCLSGLAPLWWKIGFVPASGFTAGLVVGYLAYITVHHGSHRWHPKHGSYLYRRKRAHAQHHFSEHQGNFGVTTSFWDGVFGTAAVEPRSK